MGLIVGIDIGTTKSVVAYLDQGVPKVILNHQGRRSTPSVVAYTASGERLIGHDAHRPFVANAEKTLYSIKRFLGRRFSETSDESKILCYKVAQGPNDKIQFAINNHLVEPVELYASVIRHLAAEAAAFLGEPVTDVVITVPACFNDIQRQTVKIAGEQAGLRVLRILNEPTAAALAYGLDQTLNGRIMVLDMGGGKFDVSILEVKDSIFNVKSSNGDTHLGGDDFDKAIACWLAEEYQKATGIDLCADRTALQALLGAAEKAKIELSTREETIVQLSDIALSSGTAGNGHGIARPFAVPLGRAKFDNLTASLVERCRQPILNALADAQLTTDDIDELILNGGMTHTPAIQRMIHSLAIGREPRFFDYPDEAVALGAAIQAGLLSGETLANQSKPKIIHDVVSYSIGVETADGSVVRIIERNTTIPVQKKQVIATAEDGQHSIAIHILQGEHKMAFDNVSLGIYQLEDVPPAPRGVVQIEVIFAIDANGILSISAFDQSTKKKHEVKCKTSL